LLSLAGAAGSAVVLSTAVAPQPNPGAAPRPPTPGDKTSSARHDDDDIPCIEPCLCPLRPACRTLHQVRRSLTPYFLCSTLW
jgi:hypothetical protein